MCNDTNIEYLIEEYEKLNNNNEIIVKYKDLKNQLISKIANITDVDFDRCENIFEDEQEIFVNLMKKINSDFMNEYCKCLEEYNNYINKCTMTRTKLMMIIRQITGLSFDRCAYFFKYDEEMILKIMKYIDKLEKR